VLRRPEGATQVQRRFDRSFRDKPGKAASAGSEKDPQTGAAQREILRGYADQIRHSRDLRHRSFDRNLFGEPAWDILLTLYVIDADQRRLSTRDLSKHANLALTTALRWLDYLEEHDLITRKTNTFDRRVVYVEISDKGRAAMDHYLAEMHDATLPAEGATNQ
jgi:DNA-binding MarR family transcriptional regulator